MLYSFKFLLQSLVADGGDRSLLFFSLTFFNFVPLFCNFLQSFGAKLEAAGGDRPVLSGWEA